MNAYRVVPGVLILSAVVVAGHLIPGLNYTEIGSGIRNSLHVVAFAVFAIVLLRILMPLRLRVAAPAALFIAAIVGYCAESLQYYTGNPFDVNDILRDLAGVTLGIAVRASWCSAQQQPMPGWQRVTRRALAGIFVIAIFSPLTYWLGVVTLARAASPSILSFDRWWERHIFYPLNAELAGPTVPEGPISSEEFHAEVVLSRSGRSGIRIFPEISDWTGYEYLAFDAWMTIGPPTTVTVRINDRERIGIYSNRFILTRTVTEHPARIRLPLSELASFPGYPDMDLSNIHEIVIFARDKRQGTVMSLDDIRLE